MYRNIKKFLKGNKETIVSPTNKFKEAGLHFDTQKAVLFLVFLLLVLTTVFPMLMIVLNSFKGEGGLGVAGYMDAVTSSSNLKSLVNSMKLAIGVLIGTWIVGGLLALVRSRTDFGHKRLIDKMVFLSFVVPPYVMAIAWIQFTVKGGYANRFLDTLLPGLDYSFPTYSLMATGVVLVLHLYPLVYYGLCNALERVGTELEDAARTCGVGHGKVFITITLPIFAPTFISTGLMVMGRTLANFEVASQLALPVGKPILTTQIFSAISRLDIQQASILSILLIVINTTLVILSMRFVARGRYRLNYGRSKAEKPISLGKYEKVVGLGIGLFFVGAFIIPIITILLSSFVKRWGIPLSPTILTFNNYRILFIENETMRNSMVNSIYYGCLSATVTIAFAAAIDYLRWAVNSWGSKSVTAIASIPLACPNMILAIGMMFAWIHEPFKLYGTKCIIILAYIVLFIPLAMKQIGGISDNMPVSLDKSAMSLGVPLHRRFAGIYIPYVKNGLVSGWLVCFLIALKEVSISLLLYAKGTETIGVMLYTVQSNSYGLEMTSCISVIVILLSLAGNMIVGKIGDGGKKNETFDDK